MDARDLAECTELQLVEVIRRAVGDEPAEWLVQRIARAAADGMLSREHLAEALTAIAAGRRRGSIARPGAYLHVVGKDLFRRAGLLW